MSVSRKFGAGLADPTVCDGVAKLTVITPAVLNPGKVFVQLDTSTGLQSVINTASHFTYK